MYALHGETTLLYSKKKPAKLAQTLQAGGHETCKRKVNFHFTVLLDFVRPVEFVIVKFCTTLQFTFTVP